MEKIVSIGTITDAVNRVSRMNISEQEKTTDDIFEFQPCILSVFMSMNSFINDKHQFGLILTIMIVIWESIKDYQEIKSIKISDDLFDEMADKNEAFLRYYEGERSAEEQDYLTNLQFDKYRQKNLYAYVVGSIVTDDDKRFTFDLYKRAKIVIHIKHILDCIDQVLNG